MRRSLKIAFALVLGLQLSACAACFPGAERRDALATSGQQGAIAYPGEKAPGTP